MVGFESGNVYFWRLPNGLALALSGALNINEVVFQALNVNYLS
jgi:hypothetical protein